MGERMPSTGFSGRLRVASRALTDQTGTGRDTDMILAALRIPLRNSLVEVLWSRRVVMMGGYRPSAQELAQSRSLGRPRSLSTHEERVLAELFASKRMLRVQSLPARRPSSLNRCGNWLVVERVVVGARVRRVDAVRRPRLAGDGDDWHNSGVEAFEWDNHRRRGRTRRHGSPETCDERGQASSAQCEER